MAYTTIKKPSDYFNTKLYTGDGTSNRGITGVGFQPDWVWVKERTSNSSHRLCDIVRGVTKGLFTNLTSGDQTNTNALLSFASDGFTVGDNGQVNENTQTYASWNWLASNTTASNTDGSITSTVSANTTSGFSIVSYSGNGTNGATVGHGLGVAPKAVIVKARTTGNTQNWFVNYPFGTGDGYIMLNSSNAGDGANSTVWNSTAPDASTITLGTTSGVNDATYDYIMYCFAEKQGFSKFGSYTGNGNADGTFVYTGFSPAWVMIKETSGSGAWRIYDSKRGLGGDNIGGNYKNALMADTSDVEESGATNNIIDALSNGFKLRYSFNDTNGSGGSYIYMAFAEEPLVGDNPATAR